MPDVIATKRKLATSILANKTYLPESGLCSRLHSVLMKLSKDDLASLDLLISLKINEAEARVHGFHEATSR